LELLYHTFVTVGTEEFFSSSLSLVSLAVMVCASKGGIQSFWLHESNAAFLRAFAWAALGGIKQVREAAIFHKQILELLKLLTFLGILVLSST
jgi:hypothetical protein